MKKNRKIVEKTETRITKKRELNIIENRMRKAIFQKLVKKKDNEGNR